VTAEVVQGPTTGARVVLDIGGGAGALVVYAPDELADEEVEIRPHGAHWAGVHAAVRARRVGAGVLHAGLFDNLDAGLYDLRIRPVRGDERAAWRRATVTVEVSAGVVTETSLPPTPCHRG